LKADRTVVDRTLVGVSAAHLSDKLVRSPALVAVLPWRYEGGGLFGVIVKTRVPLHDPESMIRPDLLIATPEQSETLRRPVDLVPSKPWVDVMLAGHVDLASPDGGPVRLTGALELGEEITPLLFQADRSGRIPLVRPHTTVPDGRPGEVGLNPTLDPATIDFDHPDDFPFQAYSFSHPSLGRDHGTLKPGTALRLTVEGKSEPYLDTRLPPRFPRALIDAQDGDESSRLQPLHLDTVVLDLERRELELTWRGSWFREHDPSEIERVLIGFASDEEWESGGFEDLYREMAHGFFEWAWTLEDARAGVAPAPLDEEDLEAAALDTLDSPLAPRPRRSLEEFASIQTELNEAREPRAEILKRRSMTELQFALESRAWGEAMNDEALVDPIGAPLATRYAAALAAESERHERPHERERTLRQYADVKHRMTTGDPSKVMKQEKLSLGEWIRWERRVNQELARDPRAAEELEVASKELRRLSRGDGATS
jgi:hypothetical protein